MEIINASNALVMRQHIGEAKGADGTVVILSTTMNHAPIIEINDNFIVFSWNDLINLALQELEKKKNEEV